MTKYQQKLNSIAIDGLVTDGPVRNGCK